ncbi:hypothetical protein GCM10011571_34650 [Marinithermofilum abyssi]|uniref:Serine aminopeptidase S33 domain-containing protein n=2 Tax=Marinithermofilum abyssi TaxID=1571185 RepID=A0A8J2VKS1_9BACL|nr:hypothetical protein GCM10011571_34650 [Marinithermofilum abyssi]
MMEKAQRIPGLQSMVSYDFQQKLSDPLTSLTYSFRWVQKWLIQIEEVIRYVENVTVPTLCICGKDDPLIPTDTVRSFFDSLSTQDKEWILLSGYGHRLLHSDRSASATNALIDWLNRQEQAIQDKREVESLLSIKFPIT